MIKAIVTDLDGTLLDSHDCISKNTKDKLISLEEQGVKLILASGRNYRRMIDISNELKMDVYKGYFIEVDGIVYSDLQTNQRHILHQMDADEIRSLFQYLMKETCEVQACTEQAVFSYFSDSLLPIKKKEREERNLPEDFPWTAGPWSWIFDMRKAYGKVVYVKDVQEIYGKINKLQLMDEEENIQRIYKDLQEKFGKQFEFFRTSHRQIEVLPYGYSKGFTLKRLMDLNNWNREEVIAFGDGENDVSLFWQVENSFAMGQAKEYVKKQAKYVTTSNNEEGVYKALCLFNHEIK